MRMIPNLTEGMKDIVSNARIRKQGLFLRSQGRLSTNKNWKEVRFSVGRAISFSVPIKKPLIFRGDNEEEVEQHGGKKL